MAANPDRDRSTESAAENSTQPASFETGLTQLGDIVNRLEGGGLGLSESIDAYERGVAILRRLHEELARAEERVSMLAGVDDEGRLIAERMAVPTAADRGNKAGKKPSSRTTDRSRQSGNSNGMAARPQTLPGMDDSTDGV